MAALVPEVQWRHAESNDAPYDLIVEGRFGRGYIEVKYRTADLRQAVRDAFKRPHPEPFAVVGVLGLGVPKDVISTLFLSRLYLTPMKGMRLYPPDQGARVLRSMLRRWEV